MQQMLNSALQIAALAHDGQFDKAGKPYLLHVLRVFSRLESEDEELNCIAILHDTIEDNKSISYAQLRQAGMSERVIEGVRRVTKVPGETYEEYVEKVMGSVDSMLVKRSDIRDNMDLRRLKGLTQKDFDRMKRYTILYAKIDEKLKELANAK